MKFVMEFIQELREENRQLTEMLEKSRGQLRRLKLGERQNSKVIFFIFIFCNYPKRFCVTFLNMELVNVNSERSFKNFEK